MGKGTSDNFLIFFWHVAGTRPHQVALSQQAGTAELLWTLEIMGLEGMFIANAASQVNEDMERFGLTRKGNQREAESG